MEAAGLAIGIAGIAGLYSTCLGLLSLIDDSKSIGTEYHILLSQFVAVRCIFEEWGRAVGLDINTEDSNVQQDSRLDDLEKRTVVFKLLASIKRLFEDFEKIERYGVRTSASITMNPSTSLQGACQILDSAAGRLRERTSFLRKAKWAVKDKAQFERVVQRLCDLVDALCKVVPVRRNVTDILGDSFENLHFGTEGMDPRIFDNPPGQTTSGATRTNVD